MNSTKDRRRSDRRGHEKTSYDIHKARVKAAKGLIDCAPPRPHPLSNRADMDQRRKLAAVHKGNKIMLDRLATIVQKTVDDQPNPLTAVHASFKLDMLRTKKRIEMQKITTENQRLLHRIQTVPPAYNRSDWEEHAKLNEQHKKSMALYPEYYDKTDDDKLEKPECKSSGSGTLTKHLIAKELASGVYSTSTSAPRVLSNQSTTASSKSSPVGPPQSQLLDMGISSQKSTSGIFLPPI